MKFAKVLMPLALFVAAPGSANAAGSNSPSATSCLFTFPVSWFAIMYLPCQSVRNR